MTDELFLAALVFFALATPKGKYKHINIALAGKFAFCIGVFYAMNGLGYTDGPYVDNYRAGIDLVCMFLFIYLRGYYLASICFFMVAFHLFNASLQLEDYTIIMITFQVAQLMLSLIHI